MSSLDAILLALETGRGLADVDEGLAWAALQAAGVRPSYRAAVVAAGGARAVLAAGAVPAFAPPRARRKLLDATGIAARLERLRPWLDGGGRIASSSAELQRFGDESPLCFYAAGDAPIPPLTTPTVAVVGSRAATLHHIERTARFAAALVDAGVVVVSGGAAGVDKAAENTARLHGGSVVVITGTPAERAPPCERGCLLSPYPAWEFKSARLFAARNDFIAACADIVVVVCGDARSGTRYTVQQALKLRRPVVTFAIDDEMDVLSATPRWLLESGIAHEIGDDVDVDALLRLQPRVTEAPKKEEAQLPLLPEEEEAGEEAPLLRLLRRHGGALLIDEAARRLDVSMRELLLDASALELDGTLRREGALLRLVGALERSA